MHSEFMNETMYFHSKGFQGFSLRTLQCNYGKVREKNRTDSPTVLIKSANKHIHKTTFYFLKIFFFSHSLITTNVILSFVCYINDNQAG